MKLFTSRKVLGLSALAATLIAALSAFTIVSTVSALAEETETTAPVGITSINLSLSDDIIVKMHTSAATADGSIMLHHLPLRNPL